MVALDRKLLRDLRAMWSQVLTIALVVASGVAGFITSFSAYDALSWSREVYYAESHFADVFSNVKRAPRSLLTQLSAVPGVAQVHVSHTQTVQIDLPHVSDPVMGRLIGLNPQAPPDINRVFLRSGRMVTSHRSGALEVLVSEGFAHARQLKLGDQLSALLHGKREQLVVVGIALSPEYVFAGMGGSPDVRGFGVFWLDEQALGAAYNMEGAFNHVAVRLAPLASEGAVIDHLNRLLAPYGGVSAHGRDEHLSHRMLDSEIKEQRVMGTVLPSIFLAVAGFLLNVVLSRQIATQRAQIAALKALGYDNARIGWHYFKFVFLIVVLGLVLGLGAGAVLGHWFSGLYAEVFRFPVFHYRVRLDLVVAALCLTCVAAAGATWYAIQSTVTLTPAEAMQPPAPGNFKPFFLEAWGLRHGLSPGAQMVLRHMQRRPLRTALTVMGIAVSMAVVVTGTFWRDTIDVLLNTRFHQVMRGDVSVSLIEAHPARVQYELARVAHVSAVEASRSVSVRLVHGVHVWRGALQGRAAQPSLQRIIDTQKRSFIPPQDGVLLTDRLAERLHIQPGDMLRIEVQEGQRPVFELPVTGTVVEMMGMGAYMERRSLNHHLQESDVVNQLTLAVDRGHEPEVLQHLRHMPHIAASFSKAAMLRNIQDVTARNLLVFSAILSLFATVIAVGVVYNHARIALAERAWELASLRVLGFTQGEVSSLLFGELALEIGLAIPCGMVGGYVLSSSIVQMIKTEEFFFPVVISSATYAYAVLCVVVAGVISAWIVGRRIRALDLVGVLKTRE